MPPDNRVTLSVIIPALNDEHGIRDIVDVPRPDCPVQWIDATALGPSWPGFAERP